MLPFLLLFAAGLAAGAMNAVAGGGTFAAFPALLAAGLPPTVANATSNTALLPGLAASAWTYRKSLIGFGPLPVRLMFGLTVFGGLLGALLLHFTDDATFRAVVPWLLLLASLTLTFSGWIRRHLERTGWVLSKGPAAALQFAIGIYGGYFGGAVGLIMMASWVLITHRTAKELAPARTLFVAGANAAACLLFSVLGLISWSHVLPVALGAVAGGYVGGHLGMRLPAIWVRGAVLAITYVTTAVFFLRS